MVYACLDRVFCCVFSLRAGALAVVFAVCGILGARAAHGQAGEWVWAGGSDVANLQPGVYGTKGVAAAGNHPAGRYNTASVTDSNGNFWMFGGVDSLGGYGSIHFNDLWEHSPSTNEWTWRSGKDISTAGVYGTLGVTSSANVPGAREDAVLWADHAGNIWLFGGFGYDSAGLSFFLNDLWKFDVATGEWTWMSGGSTVAGVYGGCLQGVYGTQGTGAPQNVPGARLFAIGWTDTSDDLWLFGGDKCNVDLTQAPSNDLWRYSLSTGEWTWVSGSAVGSRAGAYGTQGVGSSANTPGGRYLTCNVGTDHEGNFWLFGGLGYASSGFESYLNDLWEFNPATKEWTWHSGSSSQATPSGTLASGTLTPGFEPGVYGRLGEYAAGNVPSGRYDSVGAVDGRGRLWIFGGVSQNSSRAFNLYNDLWVFDPALKEWAWMSGSDTLACQRENSDGSCNVEGRPGIYGTLDVPAAANVPGGRASEGGWIDKSGDLWLSGGFGVDSTGTVTLLNDIWKYQRAAATSPVAATLGTMTFSPSASLTVGTSQATTISDTVTYSGAPPTGAVTYTLNGSTHAAMCTNGGSPATCSAPVPAATIASLAAGAYTVTGSFAGDSSYAATTTSGTFTVAPAGACKIPDPTNGTMKIDYYTLAESDKDGNSLPTGVSSNYVLPALGANGFPVYNTGANADSGAIVAPKDLLADDEITWWSSALNNGGAGGASDVVASSSGVVPLPFSNFSFFPPDGTGRSDSNGFQTAMLTGTLVAPAAETVSFTVAADDMAFVYLDGQIACNDGGVHAPASVPCTSSVIAAGSHTLQLFYADLNQSGAALDFNLTTSNVALGAGNQIVFGTMAFSPTASVARGTSQRITISDTLFYSGPAPTGAVSFVLNQVTYAATCTSAGSPETCTADVPAATIAGLQAGAYTVTGSFAGDCNYAVTAAPSGTFTVTRDPVVFGTMTFSPVDTVLYGTSQAVTISDTLSYPDTQPTGAVTYVLNGVPYTATCTGAGSPETCTATVPAAAIAALSVKAYRVAGSFAGDTNYLPATATPGTFTVTISSTSTKLTASATTLTFGQPLTLTATVSSPPGGIAAGAVTFLNGTTLMGTAPLNAAGAAVLTLRLPVGTYSFTAAYGGSVNDLPSSSSPPIAVTVLPAPTAITLVSSLNPAVAGSGVTFTLAVESGGGTPSGSVTLADEKTVLATLTLNATGTATYTTSRLTVGTHLLTGYYTGSGGFNPSQAALSQVILPPPDFVISTESPFTLQTQHHGLTTITVTPTDGFAGFVTLSCGDLPVYVRCEWGGPTRTNTLLAVSGGPGSTQLKIDTSAVLDYTGLSHPASQGRTGFALAGLVLPPLLLLLRRRRMATRLLACMFAVLAAMHISGCSSRYPASTPPGTYSITIQGSSGDLEHTAVLTLVVTR